MRRVVSGWQVLVRWLRLRTKLGPLGRRCGYRIEERPSRPRLKPGRLLDTGEETPVFCKPKLLSSCEPPPGSPVPGRAPRQAGAQGTSEGAAPVARLREAARREARAWTRQNCFSWDSAVDSGR